MTNFHIITLFPEAFSYLDSSMMKRAQGAGKISITLYNPRDFTTDKHRITDDKPYGGGPGMVMKAEPILKAWAKAKGRKRKVATLIFTPSGRLFDSGYTCELARDYKDIILICGHYEGVDERVVEITGAQKVSIGPYVLSGGELPAMVVVDAVARQMKGVLGSSESLEENRVASPEVYTRPEVFKYKGKNYTVPDVLLSGDHKKIEEWRQSRKAL